MGVRHFRGHPGNGRRGEKLVSQFPEIFFHDFGIGPRIAKNLRLAPSWPVGRRYSRATGAEWKIPNRKVVQKLPERVKNGHDPLKWSFFCGHIWPKRCSFASYAMRNGPRIATSPNMTLKSVTWSEIYQKQSRYRFFGPFAAQLGGFVNP